MRSQKIFAAKKFLYADEPLPPLVILFVLIPLTLIPIAVLVSVPFSLLVLYVLGFILPARSPFGFLFFISAVTAFCLPWAVVWQRYQLRRRKWKAAIEPTLGQEFIITDEDFLFAPRITKVGVLSESLSWVRATRGERIWGKSQSMMSPTSEIPSGLFSKDSPGHVAVKIANTEAVLVMSESGIFVSRRLLLVSPEYVFEIDLKFKDKVLRELITSLDERVQLYSAAVMEWGGSRGGSYNWTLKYFGEKPPRLL